MGGGPSPRGPPLLAATRRFLADPSHHFLLAYDDGAPVGFVSGIDVTHPDKGTEMFLSELAVDEAHRRRGIARALVARLAELGRARGCEAMFVLADAPDERARAFYAATNPVRAEGRDVHLGAAVSCRGRSATSRVARTKAHVRTQARRPWRPGFDPVFC